MFSDIAPISHCYILSGGSSSRFGSDKARAIIDDKPLIEYVAGQIKESWQEIEIVAVADHPNKYADLGISTICDQTPGMGPIEGLKTALQHRLSQHGSGWILLTSCDLLLVKRSWLERMLPLTSEAKDAVVMRSDRYQPFPCLYHTQLLQKLIKNDYYSFQSLLSQTSGVSTVSLPKDWPNLNDVNTPKQLQLFVKNIIHESKPQNEPSDPL